MNRIKAQIQNPILPGFYPDPSIVKVESDYYLVTSSFAYFPGVPVFHSTDLAHWEQIGHVLDRPSQLNITNQGISQGIFAPAINYHEGIFYMVTTIVGGTGNFFVYTEDPAGPWSDPVLLPEIDGIDPSFFFDESGTVYIVNNGPPPDNVPLYDGHRAIWCQEFNLKTNKLVGPGKIILNGGIDLSKKPIWIEGPHIYQQKGYYYLMAAEGGTGINHSEVILRSKDIWGPYEVFEGNPILTQRDLPKNRNNPITCTGHADLVKTPDGGWAAVFLGCRPYEGNYFNTGRETFILPVDWSGDWPVILQKNIPIPSEVNVPWDIDEGKISFAEKSSYWLDRFNEEDLSPEWVFIRTPEKQWYKLKGRGIRINALPVSLAQDGNPSFIGRRQQHMNAQFTATLKFNFSSMMESGIVAFQNENNFYSLTVLKTDKEYELRLGSASEEISTAPLKKRGGIVYMRVTVLEDEIQFEYSQDKNYWMAIGPVLDGKYLSTEVAGGFVGTIFGLYAYGLEEESAVFDRVEYREIIPAE
jgi:alpha-N-arabinofuranosidase